MKDYIFTQPKQSDNAQYYCLYGYEDFLDDNNNPRVEKEEDDRVVAKAIRNKKPKHFNDNTAHFRYYIKVNPNLEIFNPIEYHSSIKDKKLFSHINQICKSTWHFKEVDTSVFNKYIAFLKHKNAQALKDIERQLK
jgi:hypothetical protein